MDVKLSVVMPAYNEEEVIALAVSDVQLHVLDKLDNAELIVVNDGSKDATGRIVDEIAAADPRVKVVHQKNGGHGAALMTGMAAAQGEYLLLLDSDRQIALDCFPVIWAEIEKGRDAVFGVRKRRYDPALRLYLTQLVRLCVHAFFGTPLYDANVPFKLFRRSIWEEAKPLIPPETLAPSLFLAVYTVYRGFDLFEQDVLHKERDTGEVSIRRFKLLAFCWKGFRQMIQFRRSIRSA
jgi:glycosyltransferase involved in cell wall biosynthesis